MVEAHRVSPSRRASTHSRPTLTSWTTSMNSRPATTALEARLNAAVGQVHAAIWIHPSGGWSKVYG